MSPQRKNSTQKILDIIGENGFILIFIIWLIFLSLTTTTFLKSQNIFTVLRQAAIVSIAAIGEMLVMLQGGMDVSIAALLGFSGIVGVSLMVKFGMPPLLAGLVCVLVGGLIGFINGILVTKVRINSVIATLGVIVESYKLVPPAL
jgi:ribose transport system permease protein